MMTQTSVFLDFHFSDIPAETSSVALLQQHHSTIVHTVSPWRNIAHMGQVNQWPYIHTKPTLSTPSSFWLIAPPFVPPFPPISVILLRHFYLLIHHLDKPLLSLEITTRTMRVLGIFHSPAPAHN